MATLLNLFPSQPQIKNQKIKIEPTENIFGNLFITSQSLPIESHHKKIDISKKFEESLKRTQKPSKKSNTILDLIDKNDFIIIDGKRYRKIHRERYKSEPGKLPKEFDQRRASDLVDKLLLDIYGRTIERPLKMTETDYGSMTSIKSYEGKTNENYKYNRLITKNVKELRHLLLAYQDRVKIINNNLVKYLKKKDALKTKQEKLCNIITANLQAHSCKRSEDTNMRFSPSPPTAGGDTGFTQWRDAMKMVARLPGGIPSDFRRKLWLALAEKHLQSRGVNWTKEEKICFNEWTNPDDSELGIQIVKDLHRTGCSLFCGAAGQENQALLKRVLLAYARWNKQVGYCQGFNMLAALILQVMDKNETDSLKVMIYLIEGVLPESYFANNLRGLSVDMVVFRDLLRMRLPHLSKHLELLQNDAREGNSYEPPLTNVFTMQWFLTLFCNCLPQSTVLRVWDLIFLEGNEILLRTAIAIWERLSDRILAVNSADEFYSIMGVLTREMLEFGLVDSNTLIKSIVSIGACPELNEMRDRYLYNITPWTQSVQTAAKKGFRLFYSDDDDNESDNDERVAVTTAYGMNLRRKKEKSTSATNVIQPYTHGHPDRERLALDISALKKQYAKLRERQRQAHIILTAACARQPINQNPAPSPIAMNHLLLGKNAIVNAHGRRLGPPKGSIPPSRTKSKTKHREEPETLHWKDAPKVRIARRTSIESEEKPPIEDDSSSYSEDDSTSTELCDEHDKTSDLEPDDKTGGVRKMERINEDVLDVPELEKDVVGFDKDVRGLDKKDLLQLEDTSNRGKDTSGYGTETDIKSVGMETIKNKSPERERSGEMGKKSVTERKSPEKTRSPDLETKLYLKPKPPDLEIKSTDVEIKSPARDTNPSDLTTVNLRDIHPTKHDVIQLKKNEIHLKNQENNNLDNLINFEKIPETIHILEDPEVKEDRLRILDDNYQKYIGELIETGLKDSGNNEKNLDTKTREETIETTEIISDPNEIKNDKPVSGEIKQSDVEAKEIESQEIEMEPQECKNPDVRMESQKVQIEPKDLQTAAMKELEEFAFKSADKSDHKLIPSDLPKNTSDSSKVLVFPIEHDSFDLDVSKDKTTPPGCIDIKDTLEETEWIETFESPERVEVQEIAEIPTGIFPVGTKKWEATFDESPTSLKEFGNFISHSEKSIADEISEAQSVSNASEAVEVSPKFTSEVLDAVPTSEAQYEMSRDEASPTSSLKSTILEHIEPPEDSAKNLIDMETCQRKLDAERRRQEMEKILSANNFLIQSSPKKQIHKPASEAPKKDSTKRQQEMQEILSANTILLSSSPKKVTEEQKEDVDKEQDDMDNGCDEVEADNNDVAPKETGVDVVTSVEIKDVNASDVDDERSEDFDSTSVEAPKSPKEELIDFDQSNAEDRHLEILDDLKNIDFGHPQPPTISPEAPKSSTSEAQNTSTELSEIPKTSESSKNLSEDSKKKDTSLKLYDENLLIFDEIDTSNPTKSSFIEDTLSGLASFSSTPTPSILHDDHYSEPIKKDSDFEQFLEERVKKLKQSNSIDTISSPTLNEESLKTIDVFVSDFSEDQSLAESEDIYLQQDFLTIEERRFEAGRRNSERALKIIQENSAILHRILLHQSKSTEADETSNEASPKKIFIRSDSLPADIKERRKYVKSPQKSLDLILPIMEEDRIKFDEQVCEEVEDETNEFRIEVSDAGVEVNESSKKDDEMESSGREFSKEKMHDSREHRKASNEEALAAKKEISPVTSAGMERSPEGKSVNISSEVERSIEDLPYKKNTSQLQERCSGEVSIKVVSSKEDIHDLDKITNPEDEFRRSGNDMDRSKEDVSLSRKSHPLVSPEDEVTPPREELVRLGKEYTSKEYPSLSGNDSYSSQAYYKEVSRSREFYPADKESSTSRDASKEDYISRRDLYSSRDRLPTRESYGSRELYGSRETSSSGDRSREVYGSRERLFCGSRDRLSSKDFYGSMEGLSSKDIFGSRETMSREVYGSRDRLSRDIYGSRDRLPSRESYNGRESISKEVRRFGEYAAREHSMETYRSGTFMESDDFSSKKDYLSKEELYASPRRFRRSNTDSSSKGSKFNRYSLNLEDLQNKYDTELNRGEFQDKKTCRSRYQDPSYRRSLNLEDLQKNEVRKIQDFMVEDDRRETRSLERKYLMEKRFEPVERTSRSLERGKLDEAERNYDVERKHQLEMKYDLFEKKCQDSRRYEKERRELLGMDEKMRKPEKKLSSEGETKRLEALEKERKQLMWLEDVKRELLGMKDEFLGLKDGSINEPKNLDELSPLERRYEEYLRSKNEDNFKKSRSVEIKRGDEGEFKVDRNSFENEIKELFYTEILQGEVNASVKRNIGGDASVRMENDRRCLEDGTVNGTRRTEESSRRSEDASRRMGEGDCKNVEQGRSRRVEDERKRRIQEEGRRTEDVLQSPIDKPYKYEEQLERRKRLDILPSPEDYRKTDKLLKSPEELSPSEVGASSQIDNNPNNSGHIPSYTKQDRTKLTINLKSSNTSSISPEISPQNNISCLQFTSFQKDLPCTSKFSPICSKDKESPKSEGKTFGINLPTLSPPRRSNRSPISPQKHFNPFPVQPTTRQPKELGVKLGLYKDLSPLKSPSKW